MSAPGTNADGLLERVALGAVAGLAGTVALQGLRTASQKWLPDTMPPIREEPGAFVVEKVEEAAGVDKADVPQTAETVAAQGLAMGYRMTAGALYAALRPQTGNPLAGGVVLGVGTWAVGYLGWLPAWGLMPPVTEQEPEQALTAPVSHALFGIATAAAYRWLDRRL